jgi:T5SS/PEP-CTERM-associated repeat protein
MRHTSRTTTHQSASVPGRHRSTILLIAIMRRGIVLACLGALTLCIGQASANVGPSLDVVLIEQPGGATQIPAKDPFNPGVGLAVGGNVIDGSLAPTDKQITFEGIIDIKNPLDPADDTNQNVDIIVGQTSSGSLLIDGGSALRDENLIIGDSAKVGGATGVIRRGAGTVTITGPGSLYNNDPTIIPPLPANFAGSLVPRAINAADGYDLYVGRSGNGTLNITAGGTAQIQDAIVAGDQSQTTGIIIVDGFDSFLGNTGGSTGAGIHQMVIGHLGTGQMNITNGGQVVANGPNITGGSTLTVGAVVGSDPTTDAQPQVFSGGQGSVTVDGIGSKWIIGGALQLGGFDSTKLNGTPVTEDLPGAFVQYPGNAGIGLLTVKNGGLVDIVSPTPITGPTSQAFDVLVGLKGVIKLAVGSIQIDNGATTTGGGQPTANITTYRLVNDGNVGGNGSITIGQFENRSLGQVHVGIGETLVVNSTGQFINPAVSEELLSNYGLIDVLGTETTRAEINFNRTPSLVTGNNEQVRPFINFRQVIAPTNGGRQVGDIVGQNSTFRFQSGMENHGNVKFTGGTNIVSGNVVNCSATEAACVAATPGRGLILITGDQTTVTFEDNVFNSGTFQIDSANSPVTIDGNLTFGVNSLLTTTLGSHISVAGDLIFSGLGGTSFFTANLLNLNSLAIGQQYSVVTFSGNLIGAAVGDFVGNQPLGNGLELQGRIFQNAVQFLVCSNLGICTAGGMLPPTGDADLNNDGIVNAADLAIWRARFGLMGLGDVNGDGIVDAADYTLIRDHFGHPSGAGAGAGSAAGAAVPEPGSVALLLTGGLLALVLVRRERAR